MRPSLLIVGCSTRAAAWSALRAGFQPICADQFGDADLRAVAQVIPVRQFPHSVPDDVAAVCTDAWLFTGGLEHQVDLRREIGKQTNKGPCLGSRAAPLSPQAVQAIAQAAGFRPLQVWGAGESVPPDVGTYLSKPIRSGGGQGIRVRSATPQPCISEGCYGQEYVTGDDGSAILLLTKQRCEVLGATVQLIGTQHWGAAEPFGYAGSIGPISLPNQDRDRLRRFGELLAEQDLRGLIGVDFVTGRHGLQPVEVNPRYTASCEILELAQGRSFLREAVQKLHPELLPGKYCGPATRRVSPSTVVGKRVLYAHQRCRWAEMPPRYLPRSVWDTPLVADLPATGTICESGQPVCTVFASGRTPGEVAEKLRRRAERVGRRCLPVG